MKTLRIAFRNIFRNSRRSLMTIMAISVSAASILLFGGYVFSIMYGLQTIFVQGIGHFHIYQSGFFEYGAGNPSVYGIRDSEKVIASISSDPKLKDLIRIATPMLIVFGIAGNSSENVSKIFFGTGIVPSDHDRMKKWNDYDLWMTQSTESGLSDNDTEGGVIGIGMARILRLCDELKIPNCQPPKREPVKSESQTATAQADKRPKLSLIASSTSGGAPNVVTMYVNKAEDQGFKELDDNFATMNISLAQKLLYGRGDKKVTGIILQLRHTKDMPFVKSRLKELFAENKLDFEVKEFGELRPNYGQIIGLFVSIFTFVSFVMGTIVLFTIINTMSMSVMERVNEIGTIRTLGVRRGGVMLQFLYEGSVLGMSGATIGTILAIIIASLINMSGLTWMPPGYVKPVLLTILIMQNPMFVASCWLFLVILSSISSFFPARKAGRMIIVDALRHV